MSFPIEDSSVLSVKTASKKSRESDFERALYVICSDTVYYSLFFYGNSIILYSECLNPKYSLFILFFKPLFIIHYSASTPEPRNSFWQSLQSKGGKDFNASKIILNDLIITIMAFSQVTFF